MAERSGSRERRQLCEEVCCEEMRGWEWEGVRIPGLSSCGAFLRNGVGLNADGEGLLWREALKRGEESSGDPCGNSRRDWLCRRVSALTVAGWTEDWTAAVTV